MSACDCEVLISTSPIQYRRTHIIPPQPSEKGANTGTRAAPWETALNHRNLRTGGCSLSKPLQLAQHS